MDGPRIRPLAIRAVNSATLRFCVRPVFIWDAVIPVELYNAIILQGNIIEVSQHRAYLGYIDLGTAFSAARKICWPPGRRVGRLALVEVGGNTHPRTAGNAVEPITVVKSRQRLLDELALAHGTIIPTASDTASYRGHDD